MSNNDNSISKKRMIALAAKSGQEVDIDTADAITWAHIYPDATEEVRTGKIWCDAPPLGGKAWWVIPDERRDDEPNILCVVRSSRRARIGMDRLIKGRIVWLQKGGRYIDKGEFFSEHHQDSTTGRASRRTFTGFHGRSGPQRPADPPPGPLGQS